MRNFLSVHLFLRLCGLLFFLLPVSSFASYLTILGEPNLQVRTVGDTLEMQGTYTIENKGDEPARDVFPALKLGGWSWTGAPKTLQPNSREVWQVTASVPTLRFACGEHDSCAGLKLPLKGNFPLLVRRHYASANGKQYSAAEVLTIPVGDLSPDELNRLRVSDVMLKFECSGDGQEFGCVTQARNAGTSDIQAALSSHASQELEVLSVPSILPIAAGGGGTAQGQVRNFAGVEGSTYAFYSIIQWDDGGVRNVRVASQGMKIERMRPFRWFLVPAVGVVGVLTWCFYLFVFVKKSKKAGGVT